MFELEKDMGMMKIIMVMMMMMLLVGIIWEMKVIFVGYVVCVKYCNDLCLFKVGDRNCVFNCIFFICGFFFLKNICYFKVNIFL